MSQINWLEMLGWSEDELDDMRYVAYCYIRQGVYDVALTFLDALEVLTPLSPYDLQTLGALHLQMGDGLKALEHLERALRLEPAHLSTQLNRAKALLLLGYKRQGLSQAMELQKSDDPQIAAQASALVLAYQ